MLTGQRLNSQRLKSQELPDYEPSEEMADDEDAPQGRRLSMGARLPEMPMQRSASLASRANSVDSLPYHMSTKSARRCCPACLSIADLAFSVASCMILYHVKMRKAVGSVAAAKMCLLCSVRMEHAHQVCLRVQGII